MTIENKKSMVIVLNKDLSIQQIVDKSLLKLNDYYHIRELNINVFNFNINKNLLKLAENQKKDFCVLVSIFSVADFIIIIELDLTETELCLLRLMS